MLTLLDLWRIQSGVKTSQAAADQELTSLNLKFTKTSSLVFKAREKTFILELLFVWVRVSYNDKYIYKWQQLPLM